LREKRGQTLGDLAEKTGFSTALLSQMENQVISPPLGAMIHLARALECSLGELVHDLSGEAFAIVRADERRPASRFASTSGVSYGYAYESLAEVGGGPFTPFLVTLEPGAAPRPPSTHDGQEFIYVLSGKVRVSLGGFTDLLKKGDSMAYRSSVPHRLACGDDKPAVILAVLG
ncbi:MAG: XRE family transcriptional regulator, partial [Proteobacteria bacterium]|nr:XRE family transcriptional regulator [Pseudomonadota bacterium]